MNNKASIERFFNALENGDIDTITSLISDDVTWEIIGIGNRSKDDICQSLTNTINGTISRNVEILCLLADEHTGHALVKTEFTFTDHRKLINKLSLSYRFSDGKISQCTEFMDVDSVRGFFKS